MPRSSDDPALTKRPLGSKPSEAGIRPPSAWSGLPRIAMLWIALPLSAVYVGLCGYMYVRQRDLIYYPQLTRVEAGTTDFSLEHGGVTLRGWVVNPGQPRALLYFGGNAESIQYNRESFARWFPNHTVYLVSYRGFGASEGDPTERDLFADALALYDHVRRRHRGSIDVIGRSLGSGVASHVAAHRRVRRLALVTPYDTIAHVGQAHYRWLPVQWMARDRFDSVRHLAQYRGPLLVVRAGRDTVIPAANTQRLIDSLPQPPVVLEVPTADHGNVILDPVYARGLSRFFATRGAGRTVPQSPAGSAGSGQRRMPGGMGSRQAVQHGGVAGG